MLLFICSSISNYYPKIFCIVFEQEECNFNNIEMNISEPLRQRVRVRIQHNQV